MGSKYKLGNIFWTQGKDVLLTYLKTYLDTCGYHCKVSCWNPHWVRNHDPVIHDSLWSYCNDFTPLYLANHLLPSVHPNLKQRWLKNSSPKMKGLVIPSQTTNLWVKLQGPILKLTTIETVTLTSWPLAVLIHVLLPDIWCKSPSTATVSYLMQLTCAPILNSDENTWSYTFILNVVPLVFPVFIKKYLFFFCTVTCVLTSVVLC